MLLSVEWGQFLSFPFRRVAPPINTFTFCMFLCFVYILEVAQFSSAIGGQYDQANYGQGYWLFQLKPMQV